MDSNKKIVVSINSGTIFWVLLSLLGLVFVSSIIDVLLFVFAAILIALAICPVVDWLEKKHINRTFSSLFILFSFFGLLFATIASIAVPFITQIELFIQKLPFLIESFVPYNIDFTQLQSQLSFVPAQIYHLAIGTASSILTVFSMIVVSYYMIQEIHRLPEYLKYWFGESKGKKYTEISHKLEIQIGNWVRGELLLMTIVGLLSYFGYLIIGLPYTVALGVIAGLFELVPNIGPTVAAIPAILVGFSISPTTGVAALVVAVLVQQLENNLIVPRVMQKTIGLNPIVTIITIMIGFKLGGPLLAVMSLPLVLSLRVILGHVKFNQETNFPEIH